MHTRENILPSDVWGTLGGVFLPSRQLCSCKPVSAHSSCPETHPSAKLSSTGLDQKDRNYGTGAEK